MTEINVINWSKAERKGIVDFFKKQIALKEQESEASMAKSLIKTKRSAFPPHPAEVIRDDIERAARSITEVAGSLNVNRSYFHRLLNCRSVVTAEMAVKLERVLGRTAEEWLSMQATHDIAAVRQRTPHTRIPASQMTPGGQL